MHVQVQTCLYKVKRQPIWSTTAHQHSLPQKQHGMRKISFHSTLLTTKKQQV